MVPNEASVRPLFSKAFLATRSVVHRPAAASGHSVGMPTHRLPPETYCILARAQVMRTHSGSQFCNSALSSEAPSSSDPEIRSSQGNAVCFSHQHVRPGDAPSEDPTARLGDPGPAAQLPSLLWLFREPGLGWEGAGSGKLGTSPEALGVHCISPSLRRPREGKALPRIPRRVRGRARNRCG